MRCVLLSSAICFAATTNWLSADDDDVQVTKAASGTAPIVAKPSSETVKDAAARGLPFLETAGVAWMNEQRCLSCHHIPFQLWTHRSALDHGLAVDASKLTAWNDWAIKNSQQHRNQFKLTQGSLEAADLSVSVRERLAAIADQGFPNEAALTNKLALLLSPEELASLQAQLLKLASLSLYAADRSGGGLDVLAQLTFSGVFRQDVDDFRVFQRGLIELIQQMQLENGSWTPGIQFASMRRWSLEAANQTTTMWAALAMGGGGDASLVVSKDLERALTYLREQVPESKNVEWLTTRMLLVRRFGTSDDLESIRQQLLRVQNPDGGWSWIEGDASDAYTSGFVLYSLSRCAAEPSADAIRSGTRFLLNSQQSDGTWLTPSRKISKTTDPERLRARDEIYHYWGTAWSVLGLLETLPTGAR